MSFKDYFDKATTIQALANKSAQEIGAEVESVGYHEQDIVREERFIPQVDYTQPGSFARYGLAEEYYSQALKRIYDEYPYDGSLEERVKWENDSTYLDLHIFDKEYPRTNGYVLFSPAGWGSLDGSLTSDGYGLPATQEYIAFSGGPHPNPDGMSPYSTQFTGSNYYETAKNRENNLKYDLQNKGVSVEFWLKKAAFDPTKTQKEVVYDLWNGGTAGSDDYGRLIIQLSASGHGDAGANPFLVTLFSGNVGIATASVCPATVTTASVADNAWHHYAFTFMSASTSTGVDVDFYIDGNLSNTTALNTLDDRYGTSAGLNEVTGALRARIGALVASPSGSTAAASAGKLSASLDEFRYWKIERTGKEIGRHWFTQVGGGTNDDPTPYVETTEVINTNLGVYYKFNEGITGVEATDSVVLDYSGRISNGAWTGYVTDSRSTGSAIVESSAAIKEFKDPIIYSFHPEVVSLSTRLQISGSNYDTNNNASIYNSIPSWMVEEDIEGQSEIKHLTQILSSYFDTLHLQVESLSKIQNVDYVSGSSKPYPFADRRLASQGLFAPNLFLDADVLEKLADRSEDRVYEKSLTDIKNTIYQNIYNNLVYIYKSKGTEKAFRNMIRCFGIDDELVKLNAYAGNLEYDIRDNRRIVSVAEKFVDFNTADGTTATVFQFQDPTDTTNTSGYLPGNAQMTGGYAQTLEADILFPLKPDENSATYVDTNVISSSLFGMHGVINSETDTAWDYVRDASNFQVYAVRDEVTSDNARFVLTGTAGGFVPALESELFEDVYSNTHWNLSVRIKPEEYPWAGSVAGYSTNYIVELHGVQLDAGIIRNEFTVSDTITAPAAGFVSGSKRAYVGAHRTNFTGTVLQTSDIKVDACRYWLDYLDDKTLAGHAFDTQNYGSLNPHYSAFPFVSSSLTNEVLQADTLVFNWEFSNNTGSNASGQFRVADESSGSAAIATSRFRWAGPLLGMQYTSLGYDFAASTTKAVDKDFILSSKLQLPENVQSSDMVNVLSQQDQDVFTRDSRPINYFFAFEKSMAQAVSVEMINYFATLKDINNLIGAPVNRYRTEYKGLRILRQRFFERVSNDVIDFDKFYEFYKWFDTSLSTMIQQLVPASADFAENVRTLVESHVLERSKYQHKFQNVKQQLNTIEGTAVGSQQTGEMNNSPDSDPQGTGFYSLNAFSRRQLGSSQPIDFKSWNLDHAPLDVVPPTPLSLLFDGADEYVNIGTAATWDALIGGAGAAAKAFSFSLWLKPAAWVDSTPGIITFGTLDRGLICNIGSGPADTRLFAKLDTGGSIGAMSSAGELTLNTWQHITVTYPGGTGGTMKIYVNASEVSYDSQPTGAPDAITGLDCVIGAEGTDTTACLAGNMADVAVWDKALSTGEISEIYGGGQRVKLTLTTCKANLLSWWQLGNGTGDTYNGTLADEVGGRNGTPTNFDAAGDIEADSPVFSANYNGPAENSKAIWWRSRAGRGIPTISSSYAAVNTNKQVMLKSIEKGNTRAQNSVYRFGAGGNRTLGGVGTAANKKADFVFKATQPFGAGAGAAPENVMVGLGSGVEQLINTTDEYHPAFKQRLGFDMNPDVNRGTTDTNAMDGNVLAPFSLYSSSVESNVNRLVADNYATGTMITNLHHDLVYDSDIPAQGPFTEKFVGGRQYRHQPLNTSASQQLTNPYAPSGLDSPETRPEGWKIEFYGVSSSAITEFADPMIAVVPPNFDGTQIPFYNEHIPTGHRLRNVGTKRPVNIRNIKMTTSSIGNYEKNYQVVQSNSRRKNDPYFNDQSFDFAVYPETAIGRTRHPMEIQKATSTKSVLFDGSDDYLSSSAGPAAWAAKIGGTGASIKPFTVAAWVKPDTLANGDTIWVAGKTSAAWRAIQVYHANGTVSVSFASTNWYVRSKTGALEVDTWKHIIVSHPGGDSTAPSIYINGEFANLTEVTSGTPGDITLHGVTIGAYNVTSGPFGEFDGNITDVAVWDRGLTATEAIVLYNDGNQPDLRTVLNGGLISWWRMGDTDGDSNTTIQDQMGFSNLTAVNGPTIQTDAPYPIVESTLNFALADRSGLNSNQSIIVNRFSSPGEYKTLSRGYLDPAHEELSVYNASPYRNRAVINYGLSGSATADPIAAKTITVVDQIDKNRGLDQRATLHCGRFGSDAAYGSVVASTYVTVPSWHKTNRNPRTRMQNDLSLAEGVMPAQSSYTASVYDNLYVQHQIPQSEQQYSWITASMASGEVIYGLDAPACISSSTMSQLITASEVGSFQTIPGFSAHYRYYGMDKVGIRAAGGGTNMIPVDFVGLSTIVVDPVDPGPGQHTLGFPQLEINRPGGSSNRSTSNYINGDITPGQSYGYIYEISPYSPGPATILNAILLNRNGPYSWPTWKQIRAGESKTARKLRNLNLIGQIVPPPTFDTPTGFVQGLKANTFVDYIEQPVASNAKPVFFAFEDNDANPDVANNLAMNVSYQNNLDYFSNEPLNNRLGVNERRLVNVGTAFNTVADFTLTANLSTVIRYGERIYPAETNVYQTRTRTREDYSIADIWNDVRILRSTLAPNGGATGSQGLGNSLASVWPMDANILIETIPPSPGIGGGAGELLNNYSRFTGSAVDGGLLTLTASATYVMPILSQPAAVYNYIAGGTPWTAAEQAGINPYQPYLNYAENIRVVGKDMSIVPEFRISEHMSQYVTSDGNNFLQKLDNVFTLTGSAPSSSAGTDFYKLYSTADFMKYFKVVDDELADKTNGGSQPIRRHSIELNCDALLQFLPYKGFYPMERTQELSALLSQSIGSVLSITGSCTSSAAIRRPLYEPLISPGILFNTIKSGIAVGSMVFLGQTGGNISASLGVPYYKNMYEDNLNDTVTIVSSKDMSYKNVFLRPWNSASFDSQSSGSYGIPAVFAQQVPFEAIRDPAAYLSLNALGGRHDAIPGQGASTTAITIPNNYIYDTGVVFQSSSLGDYAGATAATQTSTHVAYLGDESPLYRYAIDNFLCETVNFFQQPLKSYVSKPEEEFLPVTKDEYYGMQVMLETSRKRPGQSGNRVFTPAVTDDTAGSRFGMYSRMSAFGPPVEYRCRSSKGGSIFDTSVMTCEPWLPPYWFGSAKVNIIFKAPYTGRVTLSDILATANTSYEYEKVSSFNLNGRYQFASPEMDAALQQITSSVDVAKKLLVVPPDTDTQQARWLIQTKFETPVLNFWGVDSPDVISGSGASGWSGDKMQIRGMWHQYGKKLQGQEGIALSVLPMNKSHVSEQFGAIKLQPLADIVGFETSTKRIGDFAEAKRIEEAIVCVPFLTDENERKFFDVDRQSQEYVTQLSLLNKYIFPPTFDFLTNPTVDPIAFYAFEFGIDLSQDDLINIWQNLPPQSNTQFQKKNATIKIQSLVDRLLDNDKNLQWMVFKVKRRAEKDYNVFTKKGLVDGLPIVEPAIDSPYSYNWPYDYFSLVELIKIDEDVVYATEDLIPEVNEGTPVIPDLREFIPAPEEMNFRIAPGTRILNRGTGEDDEPATSRAQTRRSNRRGSTTGTARTRGQTTTRMATTTRKKKNKK